MMRIGKIIMTELARVVTIELALFTTYLVS